MDIFKVIFILKDICKEIFILKDICKEIFILNDICKEIFFLKDICNYIFIFKNMAKLSLQSNNQTIKKSIFKNSITFDQINNLNNFKRDIL